MIGKGVDIYASAGTIEALKITGHRVHALTPTIPVDIGTWRVLPFPVEHDAAEPLGFVLESGDERLVYATDTAFLRYRFNNITHLMVEANYSEALLQESLHTGVVAPVVRRRIMQSHFSIENVLTMLRANDLSKVQAIYLLHLSENNADRDLFKTAVQEATGKVVIVA